MPPTPHLQKLEAAIRNKKCSETDKRLLRKARKAYVKWIQQMGQLSSKGRDRVEEMVHLLNEYKDLLEVQLIAENGSSFLKRQKGQLKLDNSVIEEFLPWLVSTDVIDGLSHSEFLVGPQKALMSLAFMPKGFDHLTKRPEIVLKLKDQDFVIGTMVHYKFSTTDEFIPSLTAKGKFALAVFAAECKVNLDKTMFQEAAGTATRLKQGCPVAKYFVIVEYLDMVPEDTRLTDVDNVYLLRKTRRLSVGQRSDAALIKQQHEQFPISVDVVWSIAQEIQSFVDAIWYDPDEAINRGSFAP